MGYRGERVMVYGKEYKLLVNFESKQEEERYETALSFFCTGTESVLFIDGEEVNNDEKTLKKD